MLRFAKLLPIVALLGGTVACDSGRHSSAGFRLPVSGDVERGKVAFVQLGCNHCHEVNGMDLRWSPRLRQTVKTLLTVRCKFIVADPGTI